MTGVTGPAAVGRAKARPVPSILTCGRGFGVGRGRASSAGARAGPSLGRWLGGELGSVSLELVLLVPVLVLLTVFVLWAGRGGRVALTADLAAEEAVTAAALCCEEDAGGASGREALVEDMLEARPGLGFLCIGGPRPDAGVGSGGGFLSERWLEFEPGRDTGGVGVLGVQFLCESDGAVAPLRGLFPTVTFHGQAAEVVQREPRFIVGFFPTLVEVEEGGPDTELLGFTVVVEPALGEEVTLAYEVDRGATTVEPEDFVGNPDLAGLLGLDSLGFGTVVIAAGAGSAEVVLPMVVDDGFFEGDELLVLELTGADLPDVVLDEDRKIWTGVIGDNDPRPYLQIVGAPRVAEGGTLEFVVRVGVEGGAEVGDIAESFTVRASTLDDPAARRAGGDCLASGVVYPWATAAQDYTPLDAMSTDGMLAFSPGGPLSVLVPVVTLDDVLSPVGEPTECVRLVLSDPSAEAPQLHSDRWKADGRIVDDEATVSVSDVTAVDAAEGDPVVFRVALDKEPAADVTLGYTLGPDAREGAHQATPAVGGSCTDGEDYLGAAGQVTIAALSLEATFEVRTCEDVLVERGETFWVGLSRDGGEVVVPAGTGAHGTIRNDDIPVISVSPATVEGIEGQADRLAFTVGLTVGGDPAQLSEDITVAYVIGGDGSDPATAPGEPDADYAVTLDTATLGSTLQGTLAFTAATPGTEHVFEVELLADHLLEDPETFVLRLSDADGADGWMLDEVAATGTIRDDAPPVLSVEGFTGPEGTTQSFTVTLSGARAGETVTVDYDISGGTGPGAATAPGSSDPADFEPASDPLGGVLTFSPGVPAVVERTIDVSLLHDTVIEGPEELRLMLSSPSQAVLFDRDPDNSTDEPYGVGTIEDVDPPVLSVDGFTGPEGTTQSFTVTLANPRAGETVTVDYAITGGTGTGAATAPGSSDPADFAVSDPLTATVTFSYGVPGQADVVERTIDVSLLRDTLIEVNEELRLVLSSPSRAVLFDHDPVAGGVQAYGVGTIEDVDPPVLSVDDFTGPEGTTQTFTITLSDASAGETVTVDYAITGGTGIGEASAPGSPYHDFEPVPDTGPLTATVTFGPGVPGQPDVVERTVGVSLLRDTLIEVNEELRLMLSSPSRAVLFDRDPVAGGIQAYGVGTIENVDAVPYLFVDNVAADEGLRLEFTVTVCNRRAGDTVTVDYRTANRSAAAGLDYDAVSGTLTFNDSSPPAIANPQTLCGPTTATAQSHRVGVSALADAIAEAVETFHLVLSENPNPSLPLNAALDKDIGVGTINNVNPPSVVVTDPAPAVEGESLTFTIAVEDSITGLAPTINTPVTVWYATEDRTATALDGDYTSLPPTRITFNTGSDTHPVTVLTLTDTEDENDETFALVLSDVSPHAAIGDAEGTGTIVDRPPPYVRIDNPDAVREGQPVTFTVSLHDENGDPTYTSETVTVQYATGDRTAEAGLDYEPQSNTVTFDPGDETQTITVQTSTDDIWEPVETFRVDLSQPDNAILGGAVGIGTIRPDCVNVNVDDQDNQPPAITVYDEQGPESSLRPVGWLTLSRPLCDEFSFTVHVVEGTTGSPATDDDFGFSPSPFSTAWGGRQHPASVSEEPLFAENHPFTTGKFSPLDDTLDEDDEYFYVDVTWSSAMPDHYQNRGWARATVTIIDDDDPPNLRISDAAAPAGESMTFDVTLDAASGRTVEVDYRTVDVTADGGVDYDSVSSWTTLTFAPGVESRPITVQTASNSPSETDDETFRVELANAVHAGIGDSIAVGTILAGAGPSLTIFDAAGDEGGTMSFRVALSEPSAQAVTVDYATVERTGSGAAEEGVDYQPASDTLTFQVGDDEEFIGVTVEADSTDEPDETFLVELGNQSSGVSLADASAVGTINGNVACVDRTDTNQPMPTATVSGTSASEDAGQMTMTITLTQPFCQPYNFFFQAWSLSATVNVDFAEPPSVRLPALETAVDFHAVLFDDDLVEGDETFGLRIWTGGSYGVRNLREINSYPTIIDDDVATLQVPAVGETSTAEGGFLSFVMRLDHLTVRAVTFAYETADGSVPAATAGADYALVQGTATIPPGRLSVTVAVRTIEDALDEADENVELRISNLTGAEPDPDGNIAVGTIVDDDDPPAVRVSNPSADEGQALVFAVTLDAPGGRAGSVSYRTRNGGTNGGATAVADYADTDGELVFAAGETVKTVSVQSFSDDETEGDERFFLDLTSSDFGFDKDIGTGTIRDVSERRVSVSDAVVDEGGVLSFEVGFDGPPSSRDITVGYSTVAVTAEAGADYSDDFESAPGELRILAGRTSAVVGVPTAEDTLDEGLEQLRLVLSDPVGAVLAGREAVGTIIDDDPLPLLSVDDPEATENGDGTPAVFTLRLSEVSGRDVSVRYSTRDSTAKAGEDYGAAPGEPVTIAAGAQTAPVEVALVNDDVEEEVERFFLDLTGPSNARFGDSIGAATILDDDAAPQILIDDAAAAHEAAGASVSFAVRLSRAAADAVTVDYATEDATAAAADDYTHTSGALTFAAGDTAETVVVALVDDDIAEDTETFGLRLSNPSSNSVLGNDSAVATVLDDDALPKLSVSDAPEATEGTAATFAVELSRSSTQPVTVAYAAVADPFGGDAAAIPGQDFEAVAGRLTILARTTSATVTVALPDDALDEHTETFWLRLADPTDATVEDGTGIGTIADDDALPQLNIGDSGATEGDPIQFAVTLEPASGRTVTVPWTTAVSSTGDPASPTEDYVAASGTLTFASGTTTAHIDIDTVEDEVSEPDETFQIQLGQPTHATVDDGVAVGAILDDDSLPRLSIAGTGLVETDSPATFVVTLSSPSGQAVTVDYATHAVTATAPEDYGTADGEATGTLVIPAGLDTGEISVYVADDDVPEGTETFWISLDNAQNAVIAEGAGTAVGTILDDDLGRISIGDADAYEADGTIAFPLTLSPASAGQVTVRYTTFDGSATQPDDYTAATGTLTIPAAATTATISVTLADDSFVEDPESFLLRLHDPTGVEIAAADAVGVILDDDDLPVISAAGALVYENDGTLTYVVVLDKPSDRVVTVDYATLAAYAASSNCGSMPWEPVSGTLTFPVGSRTATVVVTLIDNVMTCDSWALSLDLTNPVNAVALFQDNRSWIFNKGTRPSVRLANYSNREIIRESGDSLRVRISAWPPPINDIEITYRIDSIPLIEASTGWGQFAIDHKFGEYPSSQYAEAGSDFPIVQAGTVTITAGEQFAYFPVEVLDDNVVEPSEYFAIRLTARDGVPHRIDYDTVIVVEIVDDDGARVSAENIETIESSATAQFRIALDRPSTQPISVVYETADGSATAPDDYTHTSSTLNIAAGSTVGFVDVPLIDDDDAESDETFELRLRSASSAVIVNNAATATIRDDDGDDAVPVLTVADAQRTEDGHPTGASVCFDLAIEPAMAITDRFEVTYQFIEAPWLGEYAAEAGTDFRQDEPFVGTFWPRFSDVICVYVYADHIPERDERFILWLSDPNGIVLGNSRAWGTILNNDLPIISVDDVTVSESDGFAEFTLSLHEPGVEPASVDYTTVARTSADAPARPGDDYTTVSGTLDIPAGAPSATISVPIIGDAVDEPDETFLLALSDPELLAMGDSVAVGTITDDDDGWTIDDRSVRENAGSMVFTVIRDHTSTSAVTLNYTVTGASAVGGASCTDAGVDYITPSGSVTLLPAQTQAEISVQICPDVAVEGSETLLIQLTGVPGRKLTGVGTIVDNVSGG